MRHLLLVFSILCLSACESDKPVVEGGTVSDTGCEPANAAPYAYITSHSDGDVVPAGETEVFTGIVGDSDNELSELTVNWYVDGELVCADAAVDADGRTECDIPVTGENSVIRIEVVDPDGSVDEDVVVVKDLGDAPPENTPPTCEITAPPSGSDGDLDELVQFEGLVGDAEDAPEDLIVNWGSDTLGLLGSSTADADGNVSLDTDILTAGSHIIALQVTDSWGASCVDWISYDVQTEGETDTPPVVVITSPDDDDGFKAGESIEFEAIVNDVEDDADELTIVWESDIDGELSTDSASEDGTVDFSTDGLSEGEHVITITVTDSDGNTTTDTVVIVITSNAGPTAPDVEIVPDPAYTNNSLYAVLTAEASDPDGDAITYTYTWYVDGVFYTEGATTSVPAAATSKGQEWRVVVVASDGASSSDPVEDTVVIQNTPPSIESVSISPDSAAAGEPLSCAYAGFFDLDGDDDESRISWAVNGVYAGSGSTLTTGFGSGDTVSCTVTPNDGEDDGASLTDTITIDNTAPVLASVVLTPDPAYTDNTMVCTPGAVTDADGGTSFSYAYRWELNGVTVSGATSSTLAASRHVKHDDVQCFVTPSDADASGDEVGSNIVEISNTPPTAPEIHVEPSAPEEDDDLVCVIDVESTDLDGDSISYSFAWTVDGTPFTGAGSTVRPGDTISQEDTVAGESWVCTVTPNDGEEDGPSDSAGVTIEEQCGPLGGDGFDGEWVAESGVTSMSMLMTTVVGDNPDGIAELRVADGSLFTPGDELFVMATKGPDSDCLASGAGIWQVAKIAEIDGDLLYLRDPLLYSVDTSSGQEHQVIRVAEYSEVRVESGATMTGPAFNGSTGGVLIFRTQMLTLDSGSSISMDGRGYRGASSGASSAESHQGRIGIAGGAGGSGGAGCVGSGCVGGAGSDGTGDGAGGGSGGGNSTIAVGDSGGGGGGGMGATGGEAGAGWTTGGMGGANLSGLVTGGGGGGGAAYIGADDCADSDAERLLFGHGGTAGASGGCSDGGAGGEADGGGGCDAGASAGSGGGIIVILADEIVASSGSLVSADGVAGGDGGDGEHGAAGGNAGGGGGDGGVGSGGGRIVFVADIWGAGADLMDAHATPGAGGSGGEGGNGSCLDGLVVPGGMPDADGVDAPDECAGSGGGGATGASGADGQVHVFGSWSTTATFSYLPDPVYAIDFYGGVDCFIEM
ncbi:MAG: hypothetical protein ACPGTU_06705 [Myxococcota bacterium]